MSKVCVAASAKSLQSCLTLCDPMDCSLPGFSVHGILQARTLEWVAISFSNAWKWKVKVKSLSRVRLLATPWTAAYQAPPPMEFSRQEYWWGLPLPSLKLCATQRDVQMGAAVSSTLSRGHRRTPSTQGSPFPLPGWRECFPGNSTGVGCHCLLSHMSLL